MHVRIYKPSKNAMQSGRRQEKRWVLEFEPAAAETPDSLMGWASSPDTKRQVRLHFDHEREAINHAVNNGYTYTIIKWQDRKVTAKSYADNFSYSRVEPWTH